MFNNNDYTIDKEIASKFYRPTTSSVKEYRNRIKARWNNVGASVKRLFQFISIILAVVVLIPSVQAFT